MLHTLTMTVALALGAAAQPAGRPETPPDAPEDYAHLLPAREFESVGELLDAIEESDRRIETVRGRISHITVNTLADDRQTREGRIFLRTERDEDTDAPPVRSFVIEFDTFIANDAKRPFARKYVFDGTWLAEVDEDERVFTKYRIVPPGQSLDALADPTSAPFWIPMDRERERIERIAETELLGPTDWVEGDEMPAGLQGFVQSGAGTVQLHLVPRAGTGYAERWDDVRIWFDRRSLLPVLYVAVDHSGDQQISVLYDVEKDATLPPGTFSTATPEPSDGWDVQVQDYRGAGS